MSAADLNATEAQPPSPTLSIRVGRRSHPIHTFAEASRLTCAARDRAGIGCSEFDSPLIFMGEKQVGYVAYNGRVWPGDPDEWKPGDVPLYDNRVEA